MAGSRYIRNIFFLNFRLAFTGVIPMFTLILLNISILRVSKKKPECTSLNAALTLYLKDRIFWYENLPKKIFCIDDFTQALPPHPIFNSIKVAQYVKVRQPCQPNKKALGVNTCCHSRFSRLTVFTFTPVYILVIHALVLYPRNGLRLRKC